jgi:YD repeat-containing protein
LTAIGDAGRARRTTAARRVVAAVVLAALLLVLPTALLAQPKILYVYDDLNRLIAVIDPQGNAAIYTYDAVGNILRIERFTIDPSGTPSLTAVSPSSASSDTTLPVTLQARTSSPSAP